MKAAILNRLRRFHDTLWDIAHLTHLRNRLEEYQVRIHNESNSREKMMTQETSEEQYEKILSNALDLWLTPDFGEDREAVRAALHVHFMARFKEANRGAEPVAAMVGERPNEERIAASLNVMLQFAESMASIKKSIKEHEHLVPLNFNPASGQAIHEQKTRITAADWRYSFGKIAWLYNPWTGTPRDPRDVGSDTFGHLIKPVRGFITKIAYLDEATFLGAEPTDPIPVQMLRCLELVESVYRQNVVKDNEPSSTLKEIQRVIGLAKKRGVGVYPRGETPYFHHYDDAGTFRVGEPEDERLLSPEEIASRKQIANMYWAPRWYGSEPQEGWSIVQGNGTNRDLVAHLGRDFPEEKLNMIIAIHNTIVDFWTKKKE